MNCGKCAAEIRPQHRFCEECGTPVVSEEEQARKAAEESAERRSEKIVEEDPDVQAARDALAQAEQKARERAAQQRRAQERAREKDDARRRIDELEAERLEEEKRLRHLLEESEDDAHGEPPPHSATRVHQQKPRKDPVPGSSIAGLLTLVCAIGSAVALNFDFYEDGPALAESSSSLVFNLIPIGGCVLAGTLLLMKETASRGAGLVIGLQTCWLFLNASDLWAVISGDESAGLGFWIEKSSYTAGLLALLLLLISQIRINKPGPARELSPIILGLAVAATSLWVVGQLLVQQKLIYTRRAPTFGEFPLDFGQVSQWFDGDWIYGAELIAITAIVPLVIFMAVSWAKTRLGSWVLVGVALHIAAMKLYLLWDVWFIELNDVVSREDIQQFQLSIEAQLQIGWYLSSGAAVLLIGTFLFLAKTRATVEQESL